jgi:DNA-binding MarR family transcriptional regulator
MTPQTDTRESAALTRLQMRVLWAFLIGPQEAVTVARAISYSPQWTRAAIAVLRDRQLVMVSATYKIGRLTRVRYTLTRKGLTAAKESIR